MKTLIIAIAFVLGTTVTHARIGETQPQIETRYGKHVKDAKPITPATSAYIYRQGELGIFVGFVDGKAAYELVETVENDGDFGEGPVEAKDIDACLKANADGAWVESKMTIDQNRHWQSADGKILATYNVKSFHLLIESTEFAAQRATKK